MPNLDEVLTAIDGATNDVSSGLTTVLQPAVDGVATRVAAISAQLSTSMSAEQVAAAQASLTADVSKLQTVSNGITTLATALDGIAATPSQPVPVQPDPLPPIEG